jgi:RNA recognition motif-containing protein
MSDENNTDDFSKLSDSLKKGLSDEFSTLKGSINDISEKMDLTQKETDGMTNVSEFVDHLNTCDNNNCEIHKAQNTLNNNNYMKGFLLGAKFGKQKRN